MPRGRYRVEEIYRDCKIAEIEGANEIATELQAAAPPGEVAALHRAIDEDGGKVLSVYREPYGGRWLVLAALPIELVEPTPYQRNLSDTHVRKLEAVIGKIGRFLDPIIAVRTAKPDHAAKYWTPNGNHRLSAMRTLGAKSIVATWCRKPARPIKSSPSIRRRPTTCKRRRWK